MRAARWHGRGDVRIDEVDVPTPRVDEVLVRVIACGICGTDLEEWRDGPVTVPVDAPHPVSGARAPMTIGHEVIGVVERAASNGTGPAVGTVVIPDVVDGCLDCWWCRSGEQGLCPSLVVRGQTADGGLAEYMTARAASCVVVPNHVDPALGALAEPVAVAVRAVRKAGDVAGQHVVILGAGTIGQLIAQVVHRAGALTVIVVDPDQHRRALVSDLTGAIAVAPDQLDAAVARLREPGASTVFECTGRPGQLAVALRVARAGGTIVAVGLRDGDEAVPLERLVLGEYRILGTAAHRWDTDVAEAIRLIADGSIAVAPLVTHRVPLERMVLDGLGALADASSGAVKVLVDCGRR